MIISFYSLFISSIVACCAFNWVHPEEWNSPTIIDDDEPSSLKKGEEKIREAGTELYEKGKDKVKDLFDYSSVKERMERFMSDIRDSLPEPFGKGEIPDVRVVDTSLSMWPGYAFHTFNDSYVVLVDIPGIPTNDIRVSLKKDVVKIHAFHEACLLEDKGDGGSGICLQRKLNKSFKLPSDVDAEKISADFQDGVVVIKLPRTECNEKELKIKSEGLLKKRAREISKSLKGAFGFQ